MFYHKSKIQILSDMEFKQVAEPILRTIFHNENPFDEPFVSRIPKRLILCEFMYKLEPPLLGSFIDAARGFGDQGFFVSLIVGVEDAMPHHWYVPFDDIDAYPKIFKWNLENVIFSPSSMWGIIASPEEFALLGAETPFMDKLRERVPEIERQVEEFMIRKKRETDLGFRMDWIPRMLKHVYGEQKAKSYLEAYGFNDSL